MRPHANTHGGFKPRPDSGGSSPFDDIFSRLEPHLAGGSLSEEEAHEPWDEVHERYAERFGVDPTPGRRPIATQRAGR
jgi:hypothetical protein